MRQKIIDNYRGMTAQEFKSIRKQLGYTQEQLANIIGYSRTQVGSFERGQYTVERTIALLMNLLSNSSKPKREEIIYTVGVQYGVEEKVSKSMLHKSLYLDTPIGSKSLY